MTHIEAAAYNAGVLAVLDLARQSAQAIARRSRRPLYEGFAAEALDELAEAGRALLIQAGHDEGPAAHSVPSPTEPKGNAHG